MRNDLGYLAWFNAVVQRQIEMVGHLDRLVPRDQSGDGDDTAIPRGEPRTFPQFGKRTLRVLLQRWRHHSAVGYCLHRLRSPPVYFAVALRSRGTAFTVAERARAPIMGLRYGLPLYFARYAS